MGASSWIDGSHLAFPFPWLTEATSAASGAAETVTAASGATEAAAQTATQVVSFRFQTIHMVNNQQWSSKNARLVRINHANL